MIVHEPVQAAIWHCLNHYAYQDATFLAERLCAEVDSDESVYTLATCYYRSKQYHQAYWLLESKASKSPQCRYLLAKCAMELKRFSCAESALANDNFTEIRHLDDICEQFGEVACFALQIIAQVCALTERFDMAAEANRRALELNPFLWQSFADLCNRNQNPDPKKIFRFKSNDTFATCQGHSLNAVIAFHNEQQHVQQLKTYEQQQQQRKEPTELPTATMASSSSVPQTPVSSTLNVAAAVYPAELLTPQNFNTQQLGLITPLNAPPPAFMLGGGAVALSGIGLMRRDIDETPVSNGGHMMDTDNSNNAGGPSSQTPYRKQQFKYLSSGSPSTPSFGFLPMSSPADTSAIAMQQPYMHKELQHQQQQQQHGQSPTAGTNTSSNSNVTTPTMVSAPAAAAVVGVGKKLRGQAAGGLMTRKDTPLQLSKPIFSQTGGNITPRTPANNNQQNQNSNANNANNVSPINSAAGGGGNNALTGQNVRRSSRLSFSNCNSAVKENNKSSATAVLNKFAAPRSPPRKTKQRISKMNLTNTALNELNNEKLGKSEKQQSGTIEAVAAAAAATAAAAAAATDAPADAELIMLQQQLLHQQQQNLLLGQRLLYHTQMDNVAQMLREKRNSADGLMALLRDLGEGYAKLAQYKCADAVDAFGAVAPHHYRSSWVQSMVAKAHYELQQYEASAKIFQAVHKREPHRMHLMEIYSTVLWHLHREVALSALAQDLSAQDKRSPVTWCVTGNCFSLHKEHETAIKYFERAVQVDPEFPYSYTLLGHELVITEELDKAMSCFRSAILKDPRHYNAWFGIGTIYSKQERYQLAEIHYQRALKINPMNSVIMVHIGTMQFALKRAEMAVATMNAAIRLDPKNPLCKFHRGSMYFQMGRDKEALAELEELKQLLPKESVVYYLIGKIHKKMGNVAAALKHFSWATDLDPRGANNQIKDAFDTNMSSAAAAASQGTSASSSASTSASEISLAVGTPAEGSASRAETLAATAAAVAAVEAMNVSDSSSHSGDSMASLAAAVGGGGAAATAAAAAAATAIGGGGSGGSSLSATNSAGLLSTSGGSSGGASSAVSGDSGVGGGSTRRTSGRNARLQERRAALVADDYEEEEEDDDEDDDEDGDQEDGREYDSDSY